MDPSGADVAVAVVSWNTRELLGDCLRSMQGDAEEGLLEVWVVDNGSSDGSVDLVRRAFPWVRLLVPESNLGFGPAVNLVAGATSTPWVAPANADIELYPGAIRALLAGALADPGAGAIAPKLLLPDGSVQPSVHRFPTVRLALLRALHLHGLSRRAAAELRGGWDPDRPGRCEWVTGAFLIVRRQAWNDAGGFDESQWMYSEDLDLCWRLRQAGWAVRYDPAAVVRHVHGAAAEQAFGDHSAQSVHWMVTTYAWLARRRGIRVAWGVAFLNLAGNAAQLAVATLAETLGGRDMSRVRDRTRRGIGIHWRGLRSRRALLRQR
jgi:N-acetylglucosaminyl-diphospho-decaprenol L-rhamnosyltransferase